MSTTTSWGIIGPGKIANKFALALKLVPGARLGAVASRDIGKGRTFAATHGAPNIYDNDKQAPHPVIQAIYIATCMDFMRSMLSYV